jgi:1-deoxy-D-xylulose-5-phosphate reductoisomerase
MLTASGGPFRKRAVNTLDHVTPDEACAHPNWVMGRKISVDSATMMNKALEVIEAGHLFNVAPRAIEVVVHPQSIVHSMVEYVDGSVLAQLGHPDMRTPIAQALAFPERIETGVTALDLVSRGHLDFEAVDHERFPCVRLGYDALEAGHAACIRLNAANEIAVEAFLTGRIRFTDIGSSLARVLEDTKTAHLESLDAALACDAEARASTRALLAL